MKIHNNILECVGNTPLIRLNRLSAGIKGQIVVKHEAANPCGSVKDRIAVQMIDEAERAGKLRPGGTIIECTSGNTGLGLAMVAAVRGYRAIFTMPDKVTSEKSKLLKAFGAQVILAPTAVEPDDPRSYYSVARRLASETENSFFPNQYENPQNPEAHYRTTGPEIWRDTDGKVTHFAAGMGTGGTISGIGKYLKEKNPNVRVIGADPIGSLFFEYFTTGKIGEACTYKIDGIGEDIIPGTIDFKYIDEVIQVSDPEAYRMARRLTREEAIFSGSSAGCVMVAALRAAAQMKAGDLMVVIIPDTGERYLSKVYDDDWLKRNQLLDAGIDLSVGEILARRQTSLKGLITVAPETPAIDAINLLRDNDISQLPVIKSGKVVGSVREAQVIQLLLRGDEATRLPVSAIMDAPFPVVDSHAPADKVVELFSTGVPAVLVVSDGKEHSILTKWDVLHSVSTKR
ncbi:MAG: cysteine synthase [Planctomycetes bacterium]|nr:cysteine synthase [Planctomycetota bacterium]